MDKFDALFDRLCPMHVNLGPTGHLRRVGPTLAKLRPDRRMTGGRFLELFELQRPRSATTMHDLLALAGQPLHLRFRDEPCTALKGVLMPLPGADGAIVNLSFGISVLEAVRDYDLTSTDFAATDLAIELLYLVEANTAAMDASRKLNQRLEVARVAAQEQAYTDTLTGLKNRRALDHVLSRVAGHGRDFALMHLDLDFFKTVNDSLGHAAGDHVLQQAARIMVAETRAEDTVARVGGDEFVLLFNRGIDRRTLRAIAQRLIDRLEQPIPFGGRTCRISASIGGLCSVDATSRDPARMMQEADLALYAAKNAGRGCCRIFPEGAGTGGAGAAGALSAVKRSA